MKFYASRNSDNWETPSFIKVKYSKHYDPCPLNSTTNGLIGHWGPKAFVNPPYSDILTWVKKSINECYSWGCKVTMLVPLRPSTKWFQMLIDCGAKISFFRKRLKFSNKQNAPFESCLIYLDPKKIDLPF